jgi:serine/threonine protein kinase
MLAIRLRRLHHAQIGLASIGADVEHEELDRVMLAGVGGQAQVWRAVHRPSGRTVAVKELLPGGDVRRFRLEGNLLARLEHPNIVGLLAQLQLPWAQVLEWIEGETLEALLGRDGGLPAARVIPVLEQLARGMAHAHTRKTFHRDIKPANVMLDADRAVWLDFGIGFLPGKNRGLTTMGSVMGTPQYMAPEAFESSREFPIQREVYALGVLAYEMVKGATPFDGIDDGSNEGMGALYDAKASFAVLDPGGDVPYGLRLLICSMTARETYRRIGSMAEVAEEAAALLGR